MNLKIGIVGLPNVGKSTLFKALTRQKVEIANYPFATIDPNIGVVRVPDERLDKLAVLSNSKKIIPAVVEFVDIAGLVKGAAGGEGLGNKFLSHIREVDAIAEVVRVFEDKEIIHVSERPDPVSDVGVLEYELILKDLETVSKRLSSVESEIRGGKKGAKEEAAVLLKIIDGLNAGRSAAAVVSRELPPADETIKEIIRNLQLLTAKPIIYIFNVSEKQISASWQPDEKIKEKIGPAHYAIISAKIESELADLDEKEKKEYLSTLGLKESGLDQLIRIGYKTLGLMTFFTTGEDETRAWTIPVGSSAPRAGRAIHSDFEEKFIRAEVINWQKLVEAGSWTKARELGFLRTEGKEYIVKDGDVIEFKI
jgi:GTP-binding protein YchF